MRERREKRDREGEAIRDWGERVSKVTKHRKAEKGTNKQNMNAGLKSKGTYNTKMGGKKEEL